MAKPIRTTLANWRQKRAGLKADAFLRAKLRLQEAPELTKTRMKLRRFQKKQDEIDDRVKKIGADRDFDDIPRRDQLRMYRLFLQRTFIDMQINGIMRRLAKRELRRMQRERAKK